MCVTCLVHVVCLGSHALFGLRVLYDYCFHFIIPQYGFSFLDLFESLHSSSLGTSEELPSLYGMKTLEEQGTLSEQPLIIGIYVYVTCLLHVTHIVSTMKLPVDIHT